MRAYARLVGELRIFLLLVGQPLGYRNRDECVVGLGRTLRWVQLTLSRICHGR
jgi:hypothetical protein